jgi:hypothetical protein
MVNGRPWNVRAGDAECGDGRDRLAAQVRDVPLNQEPLHRAVPASASVSTRQIVVFDGGGAGAAPLRRYRSPGCRSRPPKNFATAGQPGDPLSWLTTPAPETDAMP